MTGCSALDCPNSSTKGFKMCHFPKDSYRRKVWTENVNRPGWVPGQSASLCEVHFSPKMWERIRIDGTRKLKCNAVPTIFGNRILNEPVMPDDNISTQDENSDEKCVEINIPDKSPIKKAPASNETIVKIIPPSSSNVPAVPILIPASALLNVQTSNTTGPIIINTQGQCVSNKASLVSGALKPPVVSSTTSTAPMVISTDPNILRSQIQLSNNQKPIIIPSVNSPFKAQRLSNAQFVNLPRVCQVTSQNCRKIPVPKYVKKAQERNTTVNVIDSSTIEMESQHNSYENHSTVVKKTGASPSITIRDPEIPEVVSGLQFGGMVQNKTETKQMEEDRFERMSKLLWKQLSLNNALRRKLNAMHHKMQEILKEENEGVHSIEFLRNVFTDDQIKALELKHTNPKSNITWSQKTMVKAIRLKEECGTRGYEELLKQNMPLPSIRTISRWCTARDIPIP